VLSSAEALNDLLTKDETLGRPSHGLLMDRADVPNTGIGKISFKITAKAFKNTSNC